MIWMLADVAWWWLVVAALVGMVLFIPAIFLVIGLGVGISGLRRWARKRRERAGKPTVAYPYYVDESGIRSLATSLKIDLPLSRQVTRSHLLSGSLRGLGAQKGRSETALFASAIDLNRFADEITDQLGADKLETDLGVTPYVRDEDVLADTVAQLERSLGETSQTRELLKALQESYETEKSESVAKAKRGELGQAAAAAKLILVQGRLARCDAAGGDEVREVQLTHLEPALRPRRIDAIIRGPDGEILDVIEADRHEVALMRQEQMRIREPSENPEPEEIPMPPGVALRVVLSDGEAFTSSGRDRIKRPDPFYGKALAHSPTYDPTSGSLTCYAYAVWGVPR